MRCFRKLFLFALLIGAGMMSQATAATAAETPRSQSESVFRNGPPLKGSKVVVPLRDYISVGAKYMVLDKRTIADNNTTQGEEETAELVMEYDSTPLLYQVALGSALDSAIFRFRYEVELYVNKLDVKFQRTPAIDPTTPGPIVRTEGEMDIYGINLNLFYDLPTIWDFITPYGGVSGMLLGMRLKMDNQDAANLSSPVVNDLLDRNDDSDGTRGFNAFYGYGFTGGVRWKIASWFALDTSYRIVRLEKCAQGAGCSLLRQDNIHEGRLDLVVKF
jgi:opacity protein-like surface antigen